MQRDRPRLIGAGEGDAAVQAPQRRQEAGADRFAEGIGRPAEGGDRAVQVVVEERRFRRHAADSQLLVAAERRRTQWRRQELRRIGAPAAFERLRRARQ